MTKNLNAGIDKFIKENIVDEEPDIPKTKNRDAIKTPRTDPIDHKDNYKAYIKSKPKTIK